MLLVIAAGHVPLGAAQCLRCGADPRRLVINPVKRKDGIMGIYWECIYICTSNGNNISLYIYTMEHSAYIYILICLYMLWNSGMKQQQEWWQHGNIMGYNGMLLRYCDCNVPMLVKTICLGI
jgi:hypothetical protein